MFLEIKKTRRVFDRVDVFGNLELKSVEDDFYLGSGDGGYEVLDSGRYIATIEEHDEGPVVTEVDEDSFSQYVNGFDRPEKYLFLEDMERTIASEDQLRTTNSAELQLVEAVERAGL